MREKIQFKGQLFQLALSSNRKEETLLKRKLSILESMEKQAANSLTLDQKILFKRFATKLRRSELVHAKLLGTRDRVKQLTQRTFSTFHTTVTDNSENAVRAILQNGQNSRMTSAPGRLQSHGTPISSAGKPSDRNDQDEEGGNKDVASKWPRVSGNDVNLGVGDLRKNCGRECNLGIKSLPVSSPWRGADKQVHFDHLQRHTTSDENSNRQRFAGECMSGTSSALITMQHQDPAANSAELRAPVSPRGRAGSRRPKGGFPSYPDNRGSPTLRPRSRNLFLGLGETQMEMACLVKARLMAKEDADFNDKVKLFIQKVKALKQQQGSLLNDYYSDKLERKNCANQHLLLDTQQEQRKWALVGAEPNHRSITIKKLDQNFIRMEIPVELLIWEYYNEILTKENQSERNWPDNKANHIVT